MGREISCSQWEGQSMHSWCLAFYPFKFCGERIFFHFSLVLKAFPLNLQWVLRMGYPIEVANRIILFIFFSIKFSYLICFAVSFTDQDPQVPTVLPNMFSIAPHFYPICFFWQMLSSFHLYRWAKGEEFYTSKYNLLFWRASIASFIFSDGSIKLACCNPKKSWTWKAHHQVHK